MQTIDGYINSNSVFLIFGAIFQIISQFLGIQVVITQIESIRMYTCTFNQLFFKFFKFLFRPRSCCVNEIRPCCGSVVIMVLSNYGVVSLQVREGELHHPIFIRYVIKILQQLNYKNSIRNRYFIVPSQVPRLQSAIIPIHYSYVTIPTQLVTIGSKFYKKKIQFYFKHFFDVRL